MDRVLLCLVALLALGSTAAPTITLASIFAAGGETTLYAQTIAKYIQFYSSLRVNVTFVTGGNGANAMHWLTQKPADGMYIATVQTPFLMTQTMYPGCPYKLSDVSTLSWSS
eukprot:m51a1_g7763 hypothetical protein (112) ;mRNA; r:128242-128697